MPKHRYTSDTDLGSRLDTLREVAGRTIKIVRARYGYAMWIIGKGGALLPMPPSLGHGVSEQVALTNAAQFLGGLEKKY